MEIKLDDDEYKIESAQGIISDSAFALSNDEIMLTNKNLIYISKGLLGGIKNIEYIPYDQFKTTGKKVHITKVEKYNMTYIQLSLKSGDMYFTFDQKSSIDEWMRLISDAVISTNDDKRSAKCASCGANISGYLYQLAKCEYCGAEQRL